MPKPMRGADLQRLWHYRDLRRIFVYQQPWWKKHAGQDARRAQVVRMLAYRYKYARHLGTWGKEYARHA